jgi:hypothetical protein
MPLPEEKVNSKKRARDEPLDEGKHKPENIKTRPIEVKDFPSCKSIKALLN